MSKKKPIRVSTAAAAFGGVHTVVTDRETGDVMTWDGESRWVRGSRELFALIADWAEDNARDEVNPCPPVWCRGVASFCSADALKRKIRFDSQPYLLALGNYQMRVDVFDLRTGERRPAQPNDRVEMLLGECPDEKFETPVWNSFLDHVTLEREDLRRYLLRLAGYTLCGMPREEIIILLKGEGGNGKGIFLRVLSELMGEHSIQVAPDFFKPTAVFRHTTELADLHNRRLIVQPEAAEGQWVVQRVKMLAGGDGTLRARRMREDQTDITLMGVPWFGVNHTPSLEGGLAMARRLRVLPFDYQPAKPDVTLKQRLRKEYRGILHQLVQEAIVYLEDGLPPVPECVTEESKAFMRDASPPLDRWLAERTERDLEAEERFNDLAEDMKKWFEDNGYKRAPTHQRFGAFLRDRGFRSQRRGRSKKSFRLGLRLVTEEEPLPF
ncbi:DNA primase family protein [Candidatus Poriferisodalis sp.]|uniref:DNA primase family protein n=1 Tax=Candidatus Poriferisodalis sp. TaxID=3101277 RepID=UPI003B024EA3